MFTTSVQAPPLKPHVSPRSGGVLTRGSRNVINTAPMVTAGLLAPVVNHPLRKAPSRLYNRSSRPQPRHGSVCPGCGIERPLSGRCAQCW